MYTLDQQTWNSVETKTGFDETIRRKINQIDSEGDGVVEKALADDQGNVISETYVKNTPTLDFLFVDAWNNDPVPSNNFTPDLLVKGTLQLSNNYPADQVWVAAYDEDYGDFIPYQGSGSDPYVPISQTTIFIHPTTFQRYLFNGTEMVEYDDVNNVVPKWLKYEALLSQSGEDAPVARVLNQDERDYLGDIAWVRDDVGIYRGSLNFDSNMIFIISGDNQAVGINIYNTLDGYVGIYVTNETDSQLNSFPIEIKVRLRGNPPKLVSAETNTTGDKVILTFDKELNSTNDGNGYNLALRTSGGDYTDYYFTSSYVSINKNVVTLNTSPIVWMNSVGILHGETVNMRIPPAGDGSLTEAIDFGILQPFENFPVTNNVIAAEE